MNAHEDWLKARTTGIGGSDVSAILGLSRWKTPLAVYQEKRGELPPQPDNEAMRWGRYLEPVVRQAYADETGREVRLPTELVRHPVHAFMIANLDGVTECGRIFEAKTARSADGWGEPGSDQIPQPYLFQVQHYMEVTGSPVADVAVLIGGSDFRLYEVPADRELQQMLIEAEAEFWQCVQRGEPPEPVSLADVQAKWGQASKSAQVLAGPRVMQAIADLRAIRADAKQLEQIEAGLKADVMKALGESDTLIDSNGRVLATWKASAPPKRLNTTALKAAHPDVYAAFLEEGDPSRRFLIKD